MKRLASLLMNRQTGSVLIWVLVFAAALGLTFSHVFSTPADMLFGRYDVYRYFGPNAYFMDATIHKGEFPLWNPLVYCGMPFAANPQTAAFYPPNLIRSILNFDPTPMSTMKSLVCLMALHLLLAGAGTYLLARSHAFGRPAAWASAIAFTLSALMVRRVCEFHFLYTLNWLPLILLCVKRVLDAPDTRGSLRNAAAGGALLGVSILGGFFQIVAYMAVAVAGYAAGLLLASDKRPMMRTAAAGNAVLLAVAVVIGAAILVPASELAQYTARGADEPVSQYSDPSSGGLGKFVEDLLVYAGMRYESEGVRASGAFALVLALAAVILGKFRRALPFLIPWLMLVDCLIGPPMPVATALKWATPFSMSTSARAFDVALLPLALLTGLGVQALGRWHASRLIFCLRVGLFSLIGAAAVLLLMDRLNGHQFMNPTLAMILIPAFGTAAAVAAAWMPRKYTILLYMQALMPLIIFFETQQWNRQYVPWLLSRGGRATPLQNEEPALPQNRRWLDPLANHGLYDLKPFINGYDPLHISDVRDVISGPPRDKKYHRLVTDKEPVERNSRGNLFLKRPLWLARRWAHAPLPPKDALYAPTSVVFLQDRPQLPLPEVAPDSAVGSSVATGQPLPLEVPRQTAPARSNSRRKMFRFTFSAPDTGDMPLHSALVVRYATTCPAAIEVTLRETKTQDVLRTESVVEPSGGRLEVPLPDFAEIQATLSVTRKGAGTFELSGAELLVDRADESGLIKIASWGANSLTAQIRDLPGDRLLLFTDAFYPGWQAYVDGVRQPVHLSNEAFKAIYLPAGTHRVEFRFVPLVVYAGLAISLAGALCLAFALWATRPREMKTGT